METFDANEIWSNKKTERQEDVAESPCNIEANLNNRRSVRIEPTRMTAADSEIKAEAKPEWMSWEKRIARTRAFNRDIESTIGTNDLDLKECLSGGKAIMSMMRLSADSGARLVNACNTHMACDTGISNKMLELYIWYCIDWVQGNTNGCLSKSAFDEFVFTQIEDPDRNPESADALRSAFARFNQDYEMFSSDPVIKKEIAVYEQVRAEGIRRLAENYASRGLPRGIYEQEYDIYNQRTEQTFGKKMFRKALQDAIRRIPGTSKSLKDLSEQLKPEIDWSRDYEWYNQEVAAKWLVEYRDSEIQSLSDFVHLKFKNAKINQLNSPITMSSVEDSISVDAHRDEWPVPF